MKQPIIALNSYDHPDTFDFCYEAEPNAERRMNKRAAVRHAIQRYNRETREWLSPRKELELELRMWGLPKRQAHRAAMGTFKVARSLKERNRAVRNELPTHAITFCSLNLLNVYSSGSDRWLDAPKARDLSKLSYSHVIPLASNEAYLDRELWIQLDHACGSDYSGDDYTLSNYQVWCTLYDSTRGTHWLPLYGGHGSYGIIVKMAAATEHMLESIAATAQDGSFLIDEDHHQRLTMELEDQAWESWACDDFKAILNQRFDVSIEEMVDDDGQYRFADFADYLESHGFESNDHYRRLFDFLSERSNTYWEIETGARAHIDIEHVCDYSGESVLHPDYSALEPISFDWILRILAIEDSPYVAIEALETAGQMTLPVELPLVKPDCPKVDWR